jgi:hypothetical protein
MLRKSVTNGGLLFADTTCANQFAQPGEVTGDRLPAFAKCLAGLHMQPSLR